MNRIKELFEQKKKNILSVYFTAGFPELNATMDVLSALQKNGADMIEVGIPFSDPLADGLVIQHSSEIALQNGMNLDLLFEQTKEMRKHVSLPIVLMGYFNPLLQYGAEKFLKRAAENGFDALILPDLPMREYELDYKHLFKKYNVKNIFLITPDTSKERILEIDNLSDAFIYLVATSGITGSKNNFSEEQNNYFEKVASYKLKNPLLAGFGISNRETFENVCKYTNGAIIGSAFINALSENKNTEFAIENFMNSILEKEKLK
ncbi:MAG TPA: tryptophan synthase subunit alpha [Bacteroidia bacterium]|nr:tryptophan synthase subunit alpha [Bacteroidia bacterium]